MESYEYANGRKNYCSISGIRNQKQNKACEDVILIDETPTIRFYGLADGQSGKMYCREGGMACLKRLFRYLSERGIPGIRQYEYIDEIQYEIMKLLRQTIAQLAQEKQVPKDMFASTLGVFAYEVQTGDYLSVHLGDGCIIGSKRNDGIIIISPPDNGMTLNYTWLTTSRDAMRHLRMGFGNIGNYERILLITDGASSIAFGKNIPGDVQDMLINDSDEAIVNFIRESNPEDDASCILVDI